MLGSRRAKGEGQRRLAGGCAFLLLGNGARVHERGCQRPGAAMRPLLLLHPPCITPAHDACQGQRVLPLLPQLHPPRISCAGRHARPTPTIFCARVRHAGTPAGLWVGTPQLSADHPAAWCATTGGGTCMHACS